MIAWMNSQSLLKSISFLLRLIINKKYRFFKKKLSSQNSFDRVRVNDGYILILIKIEFFITQILKFIMIKIVVLINLKFWKKPGIFSKPGCVAVNSLILFLPLYWTELMDFSKIFVAPTFCIYFLGGEQGWQQCKYGFWGPLANPALRKIPLNRAVITNDSHSE